MLLQCETEKGKQFRKDAALLTASISNGDVELAVINESSKLVTAVADGTLSHDMNHVLRD